MMHLGSREMSSRTRQVGEKRRKGALLGQQPIASLVVVESSFLCQASVFSER